MVSGVTRVTSETRGKWSDTWHVARLKHVVNV